jgi:predicted nucleic acid-binding protein
VDPELAVLTSTAAATVVQLLATAAWEQAKNAIVGLWRRVLPVTDMIAHRAGELRQRYRRSHCAIGLVDYLIAATALVHGLELATLNPKHFPMFTNLQPPFLSARDRDSAPNGTRWAARNRDSAPNGGGRETGARGLAENLPLTTRIDTRGAVRGGVILGVLLLGADHEQGSDHYPPAGAARARPRTWG